MSNAEEAYHVWGKFIRGAPVHSGPSVSSPVLGYAAAGTQAQLVERHSGWVRVVDPDTSKEGWIPEINVSPIEAAGMVSNILTKEAALETDTQLAVPRPPKSMKSKKPRKSYVERRRKRVGFFFRFRRR
jgi:uncharacterized protein YgiM (DUF1202 family)